MFVLLLWGCAIPHKQKEKEEILNPYIIDVESAIGHETDIPLSEIATDIAYIPLETRPDNLIDLIKQVQVTESFLFVCDRNRLLQFTRDGKFIRQIGNKGHGPGEYKNIMRFAVNEKANVVLVQGEFQMNRYDLKGNFIRKESNHTGNFVFYAPTRMASYQINDINNPTNLVINDQNLSPLYKFKNSNPRPITKLKFSIAPLYVFENELYFKENFNDTVYCVKDSLLIPHIVYKEKKLVIDKDFDLHPTGKVADLIEQLNKVNDKLRNHAILESRQFVLTSYFKGQNPREIKYTRVLFDKAKNEANTLINEEFTNDIDGGLNFWPEDIFQDSLMIGHREAFELKRFTASEDFKNSSPKYSEKKKELERLSNGLNENDNPVLVIAHLK